MELHEKKDVKTNIEQLRAIGVKLRATLPFEARCVVLDDISAVAAASGELGPGEKLIHFVRHGEGHHNVAQREWRANPKWDGVSEPYTLQTDPDFRYGDATLTERGQAQARELQARAPGLAPELLVVSPMRRATQTGLLAFEDAIRSGSLRVVAHELLHEHAGKHTCDKRLDLSALRAQFPHVDYASIESEKDPYWGNGATRETWSQLAARAAEWLRWMEAIPERNVAVASHSGFLLSMPVVPRVPAYCTQCKVHIHPPLPIFSPSRAHRFACRFNAVLTVEKSDQASWFGTGEMRSCRVRFVPRPAQ